MVPFPFEETLARLREIHGRMNDVLQLKEEIPRSCSSDSNRCSRHRQPFILHRNQWHRLLQAYSRVLRHIGDTISYILQAPLGDLFSAMASAERSLTECVAPYIHESYLFGTWLSSPNADQARSFVGTTDDCLHDDIRYDASETSDLTEEQLMELQLWMAQKALKHALSMEVPYMHMDNLLTCSVAVHDALSNYSAFRSAADVPFHRELEAEVLYAETGAKKNEVVATRPLSTHKTVQRQNLHQWDQAKHADMAAAERFFGGYVKQKMGDSSPSTLALAQFVYGRIRNDWHPNTRSGPTPAVSLDRLMLDATQFSDTTIVIGRGATSTVVLKEWMVDSHVVAHVAVKEHEMLVDEKELDEGLLQPLQGKSVMESCLRQEIATQAIVRHPNLLPLLCCTQRFKKYEHVAPNNMATSSSASAYPYAAAAAAAQPGLRYAYGNSRYMFSVRKRTKVLGLATEQMSSNLEELIQDRKLTISSNSNPSARGQSGAIAASSPFPLHVAVDIMLQIAKGMEYLHRHHIMHRDLKPANILISPDSVLPPEVIHDHDHRLLSVRVKVADFGVSKAGFYTDIASMKHSANVGTGFWRAPEVMRDDDGDLANAYYVDDDDTAKYSSKADVYSFAMVCYQILTGKAPFDDMRNPSRGIRRMIRKQHLRPEFHDSPCPMALADMIRSCWDPDTSARPKFSGIANFLRYMKMCAVQLIGAVQSDVDDQKQLLLQKLLGQPLFRIFASKNILNSLCEMWMESRRILQTPEMEFSRTEMEFSRTEMEFSTTTTVFRRRPNSPLLTDVVNKYSSSMLGSSTNNDFHTHSINPTTTTLPNATHPVNETTTTLPDSGHSNRPSSSSRVSKRRGFIARIFGRRRISPERPRRSDKAEATTIKLDMNQLYFFTYMEIENITKSFSCVLGRGGFGIVYYGKLVDGVQLAIKVLAEASRQGSREFSNEVELLSRANHRNLVKLIGYCTENKLMLVYEYMPNGSLHNILQEIRLGNLRLTWIDRLKIAIGSADGLEYLHHGCTPPIIHRDVKSSNILIDENMEGKISDFGISRSMIHSSTDREFTTTVFGSIPYLAPEIVCFQKINEKVDVYAFGVVLLELVTGQQPVSTNNHTQHQHIKDWVKSNVEGNGLLNHNIVDPTIDTYDLSSMWKVIQMALACVVPNDHERPAMSEVSFQLKIALEMERKGNETPLSTAFSKDPNNMGFYAR